MNSAYRIVYSERARVDLVRVYQHIALDSPLNAAGFVDQIVAAIDTLAFLPGRHSIVRFHKAAGTPYRIIVVDPFLIYYRVHPESHAVHIVTIRHGARRRPNRLE
jgi:plasmid stabilization system protein ParE